MGAGITVAVLSVFLLPSFTSFAVIFILIIVFNIFASPIASLADSATMNMLGEERAMYGRIRLGGTIGWGLFAPIAGAIIQNYGLKLAFWSYSAIMLINFFVSQRFVHGSHEASSSRPSGIRVLLTNRRWINFLFIAFLGGLGTFAVNAYLFPYMAELGSNETTMGFALTISTLTEMPIFFFGDRLVKQIYQLWLTSIGAGDGCCPFLITQCGKHALYGIGLTSIWRNDLSGHVAGRCFLCRSKCPRRFEVQRAGTLRRHVFWVWFGSRGIYRRIAFGKHRWARDVFCVRNHCPGGIDHCRGDQAILSRQG